MEIDAGASSDNPGTALSVPGTRPTYAVSAVFRSRDKGKAKCTNRLCRHTRGLIPQSRGLHSPWRSIMYRLK
jgi:hypothetical protein